MSNPDEELIEKDWSVLVRAIDSEKCILMLGPYADTADFGGERMPVLQGLAAFVKGKLIEEYGPELDRNYGPSYVALDPTNPPSVAQAASDVVEDLSILEEWATDFYDDIDEESEVLADLASLPFELIVNTSPAPSADRVFRHHKPTTQTSYYDRTEPSTREFPTPSVRSPVLYNLYGSLDNPASLILSDNDRLDFLVSVISDDPPLPMRLKAILKNKQRSFLFLGFDLRQWQLRVLLHVLARNTDRRYRSFASELSSAGVDETTRAYYKSGHNLSFFATDLPTFVKELRTRVESARPASGGAIPTGNDVSPDGPVVFLCHASEDKDIARRIAEGLRENGINPWLDADDLRGGDTWDDRIERTIKQDVQYVVVVQSENLKNKRIGYVNKEIMIALEWQRYHRGLAFVIPVIADDPENMLDELREIQGVDITDEGGIDRLVRAIERDLKQRRPT